MKKNCDPISEENLHFDDSYLEVLRSQTVKAVVSYFFVNHSILIKLIELKFRWLYTMKKLNDLDICP